MDRRSLTLALGAALAALAWRAPAHAQPAADRPAIRWDAPAGCPGADALRDRVVAQLGRPLRDGELDAQVKVTHKRGARWRMAIVVHTDGGDGERTLDAASCDALVDAAALIVALTIDPLADGTPRDAPDGGGDGSAGDATVRDDGRAVAPATDDEVPPDEGDRLRRDLAALDDETPPLPDLRRRVVDTSPREPRRPVDIDVRVRAGIGGELGTLPDPASGGGGGVEVALDGLALDASAYHWRQQRTYVGDTTGPGADASLTTVAVRACYGATRRRLRSAGCLGGELEAMRSEGFGFDQALPAATTLGFGVIAGVSWAYPVAGPVAVRLDITSAFLVARPVLTEARTGQILYDPNFLSWRGLAGAEVTFR